MSGDERVAVRVDELCRIGYLHGLARLFDGRRWNSTTAASVVERGKVGRGGFALPDGSDRGDAQYAAGMSFQNNRYSSLSMPRIWS